MEEYIPKSKVLELWRYWKFIEAYDQTKAMKGIGIDRLDDGTLVVAVDDATKVTRVLVEDEQKNGCLYYADKPQGEWIDAEIPLESGGSMPIQACNLCKTFYPLAYTGGGHRFCPNCGARLKGADDE